MEIFLLNLALIAIYFVNYMMFVRMLDDIRMLQPICETQTRIAKFAWVASFFFLAAMLRSQPKAFVLMVMSVSVFLSFLPKIIERGRERTFSRQILPFVHLIAFRLNSGASVETSLREAVVQQPKKIRMLFVALIERARLGVEQRGAKKFYCELERVLGLSLSNPFSARDRIDSYRYKLTIEDQLKKRVQAASAQVWGQTWIALALYLSSLVFLWQRYGWEEYLKLIALTFSWLCLGLFVMKFVVGRFQWKV